jgi:cysteinyl-tRNA synthetase
MEVRYVLLSGHYRKQLNFTFDSLHAGREALGKLAEGEAGLRKQAGCEDEAVPGYEELCGQPIGGGFDEAWQRLEHDLNTPAALGAVFKRLRYAVKLEPAEAREVWLGLHGILAALGLVLPVLEKPETVEIPDEVREIAERRWAARQAKDWAASDALRDELKAMGWVVKDGKDGYELVAG